MDPTPPAYPPPAPPPPPSASPGQVQVDVAALFRKAPPGEWMIGAALLVLFILSFISDWLSLNFGCNLVECFSGGVSLWEGFGILPAILLLLAMLWFTIRAIPSLRRALPLPIPDAVIWIGFAALEIVLFLLHWLIDGSGVAGPGWTMFAGWAFAVLLGVGALLNYQLGPKLSFASAGRPAGAWGGFAPPAGPDAAAAPATAAQPAPMADLAPASPTPQAGVGSLSPDRAYWFDGSTWQSTAQSAPPNAPRSPDGVYWWDGATWRQVPA
jgi:hypothetical protein